MGGGAQGVIYKMNLYSEANKYFEEILKEENAKLNESLKKKKLKESIGSRKKLREDDSAKSALNWEDWRTINNLIEKSMGKIVKEISQIKDSSYQYKRWYSFDSLDDIIRRIRDILETYELPLEEVEYSYGVFRDYNMMHLENVNDKIKSGKMRLFNDYKKAIDYAESITKPDGKQTRIYLIVGNKDNKAVAGYLWLKMLDPTEKIEVNNPAYNEILNLVKGNKKAANILKKWLKYVTWESSEELEDRIDGLLSDLIEEGGTSAKEAKIVADAIGWEFEDNTSSYPPISYAVYELNEDGNELEDFDTEKKAIAWAKKQPFPTHVVFFPEEDPDNDPDYAEYIEYNYDYEPYEVVWESRFDESFNRRKIIKESNNIWDEGAKEKDWVMNMLGNESDEFHDYGVIDFEDVDMDQAEDYSDMKLNPNSRLTTPAKAKQFERALNHWWNIANASYAGRDGAEDWLRQVYTPDMINYYIEFTKEEFGDDED